jgi:homoserine kinase type II
VIHPTLRRIAASLPVVAYPFKTVSGRTFVEHADHIWELTDWRPGKADYHQFPSRTKLRAAMHVLARFHALSALHGSSGAGFGTFLRRWQLANQLKQGRLADIETALKKPLDDKLDERAKRMLQLAAYQLHRFAWTEAFETAAANETFLVIRDIHHDHVLFTGDEVTGLIDFGAMDIDTPLTDIARLVGSLVGDDREDRQAAFDAYAELRPLSEDARKLIDWLDESSLVLGAMNWLTWLYLERRDMGPVEPIARRLDEIIGRLEDRVQ